MGARCSYSPAGYCSPPAPVMRCPCLLGSTGRHARSATRLPRASTRSAWHSRPTTITGRASGPPLEALGGKQNDVGGIAAITFYPFKLPFLRLTGEMVQRKGDRTFTLFVR